jgi:hypothetical protein
MEAKVSKQKDCHKGVIIFSTLPKVVWLCLIELQHMIN